jgi:hypothetical protein
MNFVWAVDKGFFPFVFPEGIQQLDVNNIVVVSLVTLSFVAFPFIYTLFYNLRGRQRPFNITIFTLGIVLILLEIFKQITYAKIYGTIGTLNYMWSILPLQLCSVHMFLCPLIPFLKGKVKQSVMVFVGLYAFIGGIAVLGFQAGLKIVLWGFFMEDGTVFGDWGMVVHTLLWHGILINLGAIIFGYLRLGDYSFSQIKITTLDSWLLCMLFLLIAQGVNLLIPLFVPGPYSKTINMWNISLFQRSSMPVFGKLWDLLLIPMGDTGLSFRPLGIVGTAIYAVLLYLGNFVVQTGIKLISKTVHKFQHVAVYTNDLRY